MKRRGRQGGWSAIRKGACLGLCAFVGITLTLLISMHHHQPLQPQLEPQQQRELQSPSSSSSVSASLPPPSQLPPPPPPPSAAVHVVFSTDCSGYQHWQGIAFWYAALAAGQAGPVTRIASGCDEEQKVAIAKEWRAIDPTG